MRTACFLTYRGPGGLSIAMYQPKWLAPWPELRRLAPGWGYNTWEPREYVRRYQARLAKLDPQVVWDEAHKRCAPYEPVLLCWERTPFSAPDDWFKADPASDGQLDLTNLCHRRMVALWFEETLGLVVPEAEAPPKRPSRQLQLELVS